MSLDSLKAELEARQAFKAWEIEENLDRYFCRPVAVLFTAAFLPLRITPNQVSVSGMLLGMVSTLFLFSESFPLRVTAVALLWLSEVLDAADGQLARMREKPSRYGRIIDGLCSMGLYLAVYGVVGYGLYMKTAAWYAPVLALAAAAAHSYQSSLYDFYRTEYIRVVKKREAVDPDSLDALHHASREEGAQGPGRRLMLWLYVQYAWRLKRTTPTYQPLKRAIGDHFGNRPVSESYALRYGEQQRKMVRWWNYLGPNMHLVALSVAIILRRAEWYLWATVFAFSLYAVLLTLVQSAASRKLMLDLRADRPEGSPARNGAPSMAQAR